MFADLPGHDPGLTSPTRVSSYDRPEAAGCGCRRKTPPENAPKSSAFKGISHPPRSERKSNDLCPLRDPVVHSVTGSLRKARTAVPHLSVIGDGVGVIRNCIWIALIVEFVGLVLWGWWYQHRRAWSIHRQDESMRRHVNRNYD